MAQSEQVTDSHRGDLNVDTNLKYCDLDPSSQARVDVDREEGLERAEKLRAGKETSMTKMRHNVKRLGAVLHYKSQMGAIETNRSQMVGRLINHSMTTGEYRAYVEAICKQEAGLREELSSVGRELCTKTHACFEDVKSLFAPPFTID